MALVDIDLTQGMNEGTAPEVQDFRKGLFLIENRYQPQTGLWEKFPGLTAIASGNDDTATANSGLTSLVRLRDSFAMIQASGFRAKVYSDVQDKTYVRGDGVVPSFAITHNEVASSPFDRYVGGTALWAFASNGTIEAAVYAEPIGTSTTDFMVKLVAIDSASRKSVKTTYLLSEASNYTFANLNGLACCFNGDLFYVALSYDTGGGTYKIGTYVSTVKSGYSGGITKAFINEASYVRGVTQQISSGTGFHILGQRIATNTIYVATISSGLAVSDSATVTNFTNTARAGIDSYQGTANKFWVAGRDTATGRLRVLGFAVGYGVSGATYDYTDGSITIGASDELYVGSKNSSDEVRIAHYAGNAAAASAVWSTLKFYKAVDNTAPNLTITTSGTISNWHPVSDPFYSSTDGLFYIQLSEDSFPSATNATGYSTNAPVCQNILTAISFLSDGAATTQTVISPAATIESFLSFRNGGIFDHYGKIYNSSGTYYGAFPALLNSNSFKINSYKLQPVSLTSVPNFAAEVTHMSAIAPSGAAFVSACSTFIIDAVGPVEAALFGRPGLYVTSSGGGVLAAGTYQYVAVWRSSDSNGNSIYSRVSEIASYASAGLAPTVQVARPCASHFNFVGSDRTNVGNIFIDIYRTKAGETQFYFLKTIGKDGTNMYVSFTDSTTDSTLGTRAKLYRQPGTNGTALERWNWQPGWQIVAHKDRLFWIGPDGKSIFYTGFYVYGESPWCNPAFRIDVPTGKLTGLASMDDRLVVFSQDAAFIIDGDGPPDNGGNGSEFSFPRKIALSFGCINSRSIQVTPVGIIYRSQRGFELLDRGFSNKFIGEAVQESAYTYAYTLDSAFDTETGCYFAAVDTGAGTAGSSRLLAYQVDTNSWSLRKRASSSNHFTRLCIANLSGTNVLIVGDKDSSTGFWKHTSSNKLDNATFVPSTIETHWMKAQGPAGRQRVKDFFFLGRKVSNHKLTLKVAVDYSSSFSQTNSWEPSTINSATIEQLIIQPAKEQALATRFRIEEAQPTDTGTYPVGSDGSGVDIFGLSVNVVPKEGEAKAPSAQKG